MATKSEIASAVASNLSMCAKCKLSFGQLHILKLCEDGADFDGWAPISKPLFPHVASLPAELLVTRKFSDGYFGKVTDAGRLILKYCASDYAPDARAIQTEIAERAAALLAGTGEIAARVEGER